MVHSDKFIMLFVKFIGSYVHLDACFQISTRMSFVPVPAVTISLMNSY